MSKMWLVLRYEIITTLRRRSFQITAFGLPLLGMLVFLAISTFSGTDGDLFGGPDEMVPQLEGYVDRAGLVETIPETVADRLVAYADEASARQAMDDGEIDAYYVIPADYVEVGDLIYINPLYRLTVDSTDQSSVMRQTLTGNLLGNDEARIERFRNVMDPEEHALAASTRRDVDNPMTYWVPYGATMLFYFVILMAASLLLNSVGTEKQNRVMEILLLSVKPRQLLAGKIIGLGAVGLLQTAVWLGMGYAVQRLSGQMSSASLGFELPFSFVLWGVVYFLLGYAIYASLMAGVGALVPNLKEASQATFMVIWPLIIPMFLISFLIEKPHGTLSVVLSLVPFTSPIAMMTRLAAGGVPWWQPLVGAVLLVATAFFIMRAVTRMFRAQALLSGQPFNAKRFYRALSGR